MEEKTTPTLSSEGCYMHNMKKETKYNKLGGNKSLAGCPRMNTCDLCKCHPPIDCNLFI